MLDKGEPSCGASEVLQDKTGWSCSPGLVFALIAKVPATALAFITGALATPAESVVTVEVLVKLTPAPVEVFGEDDSRIWNTVP